MRESELISKLIDDLNGLKGKKVAILEHVGGDPDAMASAFVLSNILTSWGVDVRGVSVPLHVSDQTEKMAVALGIILRKDLPEADAYIAVDASSITMLSPFYEDLCGELILIDHHEKSEDKIRGRIYSSTAYQSTSEIILELAESTGYVLSELEASALFAGIYFDTVRLSVADSETLRKVGRLGGYGASPRKIIQQIDSPTDYSERIARIKAVKRAEFYKCGDVLVGITRVSSFKPAAARTLLAAGAHIALVGEEIDGEAEISLRQVPEMMDQLKLNLVKDVVEPIARAFVGEGGGHASAAKLRVKGDLGQVFDRCLNQISYLLGAPTVRVID
ncbi:MAG: DHH family phosphoesterase [Nitrososphaerota archaeon]